MRNLLIVLCYLTISFSQLIKGQQITEKYLENLKSSASFQVYSFEEHPFKNQSLIQLSKKLGLITPNTILTKLVRGESNPSLPVNFNSKDKWPECIHPIRDQGQCGSCWAFAITSVLSDRICIASKNKVNVALSPQDLVSCDTSEFGCSGGFLENSWNYMIKEGAVTEDCYPYSSNEGSPGVCQLAYGKCEDFTTDAIKYKSKNYYKFRSIEEIKQEIFNNGPIETGFDVYLDFFSYKSGIYKKNSEEFAGGHAVRIIGWGVEEASNTEYWIVANSWGENWGEDGFFRIEINNCCNFESLAIAGIPVLKN